METESRPKRHVVLVMLSTADFDWSNSIRRGRRQKRADFLRGALQVADREPNINTRPLVGACLGKHRARLGREKRAGARTKKGG